MSFRYTIYVCVCVCAKMCQISNAYNNFEHSRSLGDSFWVTPARDTIVSRGNSSNGGLSKKHNKQCVDKDFIIRYRVGSFHISENEFLKLTQCYLTIKTFVLT